MGEPNSGHEDRAELPGGIGRRWRGIIPVELGYRSEVLVEVGAQRVVELTTRAMIGRRHGNKLGRGDD